MSRPVSRDGVRAIEVARVAARHRDQSSRLGVSASSLGLSLQQAFARLCAMIQAYAFFVTRAKQQHEVHAPLFAPRQPRRHEPAVRPGGCACRVLRRDRLPVRVAPHRGDDANLDCAARSPHGIRQSSSDSHRANGSRNRIAWRVYNCCEITVIASIPPPLSKISLTKRENAPDATPREAYVAGRRVAGRAV